MTTMVKFPPHSICYHCFPSNPGFPVVLEIKSDSVCVNMLLTPEMAAELGEVLREAIDWAGKGVE
jgi:hypothetical protein